MFPTSKNLKSFYLMKNYQKYEKALSFLEVFEDGSVWRKERTYVAGNSVVHHQPRQLAKTFKNHNGYLHTNVSIDGRLFNLFVHVLVALVYIPKPDGCNESWQINHINGVKTDNRVENLEWCTASENQKHAFRTGLNKPHDGGTSKPVEQYDLSTGEVIAIYKSQSEAARAVDGNQGHIWSCCNGHYKSASGYGWRYV